MLDIWRDALSIERTLSTERTLSMERRLSVAKSDEIVSSGVTNLVVERKSVLEAEFVTSGDASVADSEVDLDVADRDVLAKKVKEFCPEEEKVEYGVLLGRLLVDS